VKKAIQACGSKNSSIDSRKSYARAFGDLV